MATSTGTRKRAQPSTHPSVWAGLLLAIVGLLLAMYAYTGARIYDATYALVALGGGLLALVGILAAAWGRAIMAARAQRARRGLARPAEAAPEPAADAPVRASRFSFRRRKADDAAAAEPAPPTVAAPEEKRRKLTLPALPKLGRRKRETPDNGDATLFAFRRRGAPEGTQGGGAVALEAPAGTTEADADPTADGAAVRITIRCPQCATEFVAEGVQPIAITCPSCGLAGSV